MNSQVMVKEVYHIRGIGNVILGDIVVGYLAEGMVGSAAGLKLEIKGLSLNRKPVKYAKSGDIAGINVWVNGDADLGSMMNTGKYHSELKKLKGKTLIFEGGAEIQPAMEDSKPKKRGFFSRKTEI